MPEDKTLEAVTRMIELTQQGKLQWTTEALARGRNIEGTLMTPVFYAVYKQRLLRLYKTKIEADTSGISGFSGFRTPPPLFIIVLEIVDENGHTLWSFPSTSALDDLLAAVQYRVAGVATFLDDILTEK